MIQAQLEETVVDGPSQSLSSVVLRFQNLVMAKETRIRVELPLPDGMSTRGIEASASLMRHTEGDLRPDDYVSTAASPISSGDYALVRLRPAS